MEHWHVCRGWVQLMGDCLATSFFVLTAFHMLYDTWLRHRLVGILRKVCFRGYIFLLYPRQPGSTSVPFAWILYARLHNMLDVDTLYCLRYMFGVLVTTRCRCGLVLCVFEVLCCSLVCVFQSCMSGIEYPIGYLWTYTFIFIVYVCLCVTVWYLGVSSCVLVLPRCPFLLVGLQVSI